MKRTVPINNQVNGIFVHVTDLKKSVGWYADLIGVEVDLDQVQSPVFNLPVTGTTPVALDDHVFDPQYKHQPSPNPLFNFFAPDIDEAYQFVTSKGIKVVREIEWAGETAWFNIEDPDGNVIMICNS